jgi:pimeloyl-ACP methyl ester carboxylesterase
MTIPWTRCEPEDAYARTMRELVRDVAVDASVVRLRTRAPAGRSRDALGPTVVLLHGLGGPRSMRGLHRELSRKHRTILVEWSAGEQRAGDRGGAESAAARIAGALRTVGASDCIPIGHGQGTHIAAELARSDPGLVRAVGFVAPITDDRRRSLLTQAVDLARDVAREPFVLGVRSISGIVRHGRRAVPLVPGVLRYPLFKRVADLAVPLLVIRGHRDVLCRHDWARRLIGIASAGALIELPGNHHVHAESPRTVAALVDEFLRVEALGRLG